MGKESGYNFERIQSDRIEKKELLRELQGDLTEPVCLRGLFGRIVENDVNLAEDWNALLELGCAIDGKPTNGVYRFVCQAASCERKYVADFRSNNDVNALRSAKVSGVCFETTVANRQRLLPDPGNKF